MIDIIFGALLFWLGMKDELVNKHYENVRRAGYGVGFFWFIAVTAFVVWVIAWPVVLVAHMLEKNNVTSRP